MNSHYSKDTSEYVWALADQRRRADSDRAAVLNGLMNGLGSRLRCGLNGIFSRTGRHG
jgi:hypothetical protein